MPDPRIEITVGDITAVAVDAIVNAANSSLLGGGGVDGAIHRRGGPAILQECERLRRSHYGKGLPTGAAVITTAGNLPARHVIHTVGPVWSGGTNREPELLANCYRNSLRVAVEHGLKSIAFPGISTGIYRYPKEQAARLAVETVGAFLAEHPELERVVFVCYDQESHAIYQRLLHQRGAADAGARRS